MVLLALVCPYVHEGAQRCPSNGCLGRRRLFWSSNRASRRRFLTKPRAGRRSLPTGSFIFPLQNSQTPAL